MVRWFYHEKIHLPNGLTFISAMVFYRSLSGCSQTQNPDRQAQTLAIDQFITAWHEAAANSEHADYIGAMADNGIYIGTDATEYWTKIGFDKWSKPYFDQHRGWKFGKLSRNIYLSKSGDLAWFDELLSTSMGVCRGSGVLEQEAGKW